MHLNWHYHRAKYKSHAHCFHWSTCAHADVDYYCACAVILTLTLLMANLHYFARIVSDLKCSNLILTAVWSTLQNGESKSVDSSINATANRRQHWLVRFECLTEESFRSSEERISDFSFRSRTSSIWVVTKKPKKTKKKIYFFFTRIKMNPSASSSSECAGPMFIGVSKGEKKEKNVNNLNLIKSSHSCLFIVASA